MTEMKKIQFPRQYDEISSDDLGIEYAPGVIFKFWNNPSRGVFNTIMDVLLRDPESLAKMDKDEQDDLMKDFYEALTLYIEDTNVTELDFSTPESAQKSFSSNAVPWGFVYEMVVTYTLQNLVENKRLKKALGLLSDVKNSGEGNSPEANESKIE